MKSKLIGALALGYIMQSCTYSITMVHTQGQASDVVDEVQRPDATVEVTPI